MFRILTLVISLLLVPCLTMSLPPLITLEEHFVSEIPAGLGEAWSDFFVKRPGLQDKLFDLSDLRLRDMDEGKVSLQIISHAAGLIDPTACRTANDKLAAAIQAEERRGGGSARQGKSKYAGFAVLPMGDPDKAATELRRAVTELGFVGALIDNHARGRFYDGDEYDIWWAAVEELGVPIYLHPTFASEHDLGARYKGPNYNDSTARSLSTSTYGWHTETGLHILRLFASGLFDRRPGLKIVIGHMGETIPFMLERIDRLSRFWDEEHRRDFKTVYDENIWITTSGVWGLAPMRCILANTKIDHIMYSVDYPFTASKVGLDWMFELQKSGLVNETEFDAIAYKNAENLLGVTAPPRV